MAEDPASASEALTVPTFTTVAAGGAGRDARDQDLVTGLDIPYGRSNRLDGTDGFVAENAAVADRRDVSLEDVKIGAADRHGVHSNDGVGVGLELRVRNVLPGLPAGAVINESLHLVPLSWALMRPCPSNARDRETLRVRAKGPLCAIDLSGRWFVWLAHAPV